MQEREREIKRMYTIEMKMKFDANFDFFLSTFIKYR